MRVTSILLLLGLVSIITCSQVLKLTNSNFNSTLTSAKYVMVKFYAPWCGHCKTMVPQYIKLAQIVKDNDVVVAQVDATQQKQLGQRFGIQGFPTIKLFIDGNGIDYRGQRTAKSMYEWIKKVSQTVLQEISQQKINELKQKQSFVVYYGSNQQKRKTIQLLNLIDQTNNYYYQKSDTDKLVLYRVNKEIVQYNSSAQFIGSKIQDWAMVANMPVVVPLSSKPYLDWVFYDQQTKRDVVMLLKEDDITEQGFKNFQTFCSNNQQTYKCCFVDKKMHVYNGVTGYLKSKGKSVLGLTRNELKQAYGYPNDINTFTQQQWNQFVAQVQQGKYNNMAGEGEQINYKNVKVLSDANFTTFMKQNSVVFIEFYTDTCPHCVEFAPEYDSIAKQVYQKNLGYQMVAMNIKKNKQTATQLKIMNFPSFKVYISGQPVTYDGPRTQKAILDFIKTAKQTKPILAGSIAEVPSPAVIIYDPAEVSSLNLLPALFTRYPIYHLREGSSVKVILRLETESTYSGDLDIEKVSQWLFQKTDPVLVDLLNSNIDNKLRTALQNRVPILALLDVDSSISTSLSTTLEEYCKQSTLVCGYAKSSEQNFKQFVQWLGVDVSGGSSFIYINTQTYDKYVFPRKIQELSVESIGQFVTQVKQGKISKFEAEAKSQQNKQEKEEQAAEQTAEQTGQTTKQTAEQSGKQTSGSQAQSKQEGKQQQQSKQSEQSDQSESDKATQNEL